MKFNWMDILLMALAVRGFMVGIRRGILSELAFSTTLLAAVGAGIFMGDRIAARLMEKIPVEMNVSGQVVAWGIVILGFFAALIIAKIVQKLSHLLLNNILDKAIGGVLGVGRMILFPLILLIVLIRIPSEFFVNQTPDSVVASYLVPKVEQVYVVIKDKIVPVEVLDQTQIEEQPVEGIQNLGGGENPDTEQASQEEPAR